jgi:NADP-dependent 3-hydroxy acid dehydrogenase YdfG
VQPPLCGVGTPVVLITGALTGIGRAAAVAFAKKGAKVVVAGRRDEAGKALAKELRAFDSEAEFINADVLWRKPLYRPLRLFSWGVNRRGVPTPIGTLSC